MLQSSSPQPLWQQARFMEDNFSMDSGERGWFRDDSCILHLLCPLIYITISISSMSDHQA